MTRILRSARLVSGLVAALLVACHHPAAVSSRPSPAPAAAPKVPEGVDADAMDWHTSPCQDFFQFACGAWVARTDIPPDRSSWYLFSTMDENNELALQQILAATAAGHPPSGTAYARQLGDFYATCMDEPRLESSLPELRALLAPVEGMKSVREVPDLVARLHQQGLEALFSFSAQQNPSDATRNIPAFDQGGLGLPDPAYYLSAEPKMREVLTRYRAYLVRLFTLLGESPARADQRAGEVISLETALARASLDRVSRRDPAKVTHVMTLAALERLSPAYPWARFMAARRAPEKGPLNVAYPPFFQALSTRLRDTAVSTWKSYLTARYVIGLTPALPKRFQDEAFAFTSQALTGAQADLPRWKKCVHFSDGLLGEALARPFVAQAFSPVAKQAARAMVEHLEDTYQTDLQELSWMDAATRAQALEKLHGIANKVGYPDKWKSYDGLQTDRSSFLHNLLAAEAYEAAREVQRMGKPVDRTEWDMTPPTVNAYYSASMNEIVLPAGILQPPLFSERFAASVNFGATGASTVGHELSHGFDDEGRHYDAQGNLRDWWTPSAERAFEQRAACVARQFDRFVAVDDVHVNGKLTLGENLADLAGLKVGYGAFERYLREHPAPPAPAGERLTPEQAFFVGYAQAWCAKIRPAEVRMRTATDPHAPPRWRVNGPMSNLPSFRAAFQCKAGDPMVAKEPCEVW